MDSGSKFTRRRARKREKEREFGSVWVSGFAVIFVVRAQGFRECLGFGVGGSFCGFGLKVLGP